MLANCGAGAKYGWAIRNIHSYPVHYTAHMATDCLAPTTSTRPALLSNIAASMSMFTFSSLIYMILAIR